MAGVDDGECIDLSNALDEHGDSLADELRVLSEMPQVRLTAKAVFDRAVPKGSVAQKRGVICKLLCCGGQLDQKCNDLKGEKACATVVDAVRLLRQKVIAKHGNESCEMKAKESLAAGESSTASSSTPANALESLMQGQLSIRPHALAPPR
ncbi:hypothetical protein AB1Y20_023387 [Prymnesium parvum]|uniref:Uncharacterized protein n=1 Tax=Prymnesium parvum TaxID=97485 RepID=A0AB34JG50_PRYPA